MKRGIITMSETGTVIIPAEPVWMTQFEIADLFDVFSCNIRKVIHSIYKNKELDETETMLYIKQSDGTSFDVYGIEMIIAIAFRIQNKGSKSFRKFITEILSAKNNKAPIQLFVSCNNTESEKNDRWKN